MADNRQVQMTAENEKTLNSCGCEMIPHELYSLAMGFVPRQIWQNIYETNVALVRGTIFADLDKPFIGEEAVRNDRA